MRPKQHGAPAHARPARATPHFSRPARHLKRLWSRCAASHGDRIEVLDYVLLVRSEPAVSAEALSEAHSELLGLMYAVPGIVAAATGPIRGCRMHSSVAGQLPPAAGFALTHALHFRFSGRCARATRGCERTYGGGNGARVCA